jgi:hypothetical protein
VTVEFKFDYIVLLYFQGYYHEMENPALRNIIPDQLIGKKDILFGNLEQIYNFHRK